MAIGIENYPDIDTSDPSNYPNGNIKDDSTGVAGDGTPINVETTADIHQTFYRALAQGGITANGDPDNVSNGYQYAQAFGLEEWVDGGTVSAAMIGGSITISGGDTVYHRYRLVGRTLFWEIQLRNVTLSGISGVSVIYINLPTFPGTGGLEFRNVGGRKVVGMYDNDILFGEMTAGTGTDVTQLQLSSPTAFSNSTTAKFDISLVAELINT